MRRAFCSIAATLLIIAGPAWADDTPDSLMKKARACLAQIDGEMALPGLKEPVEVLRDRWGVPHIYAKNIDDLFFAQGFVAAQDRLFQIDLWRRVAVGESAEILGKKAIDGDRFARLLQYRGDMDAEWASYGPDARRIATAFTRGINAFIDHAGERLPIEFQLLDIKPKKWRPEDCLGRMSGIIMTSNFRNEIARAELVAALGVDKARRAAPTDPPRDFAPADGFDLSGINASVVAGYNAATRPFTPLSPGGRGDGGEGAEADHGGSNNWAVDATLSASGKPMLASDPHRNIHLPSLRYLVHLNAPGWNVIGSGEPALPGVAIGHNDRVAWGFTIVTTDQADFYVEETNRANDTEYRVGERWEAMKIIREKVPVRGEKSPVELELRFTRHGPVVHQDLKKQRAFVLKWVGSQPGTAAYLGCLALAPTRNAREFVDALKAWKSPAENMVYADLDGNIGWVAAGLTPIRKGWEGLLPVPGAAGKYEWQGFLPIKELPQIHNPASHFVVTANSNTLPKDYPHTISYEWAAPYRHERLRQRLTAAKKFTLDDFKSMQHDNTSLPGQALARLAKGMKLADAGLQPFATLLVDWDGVLSRDAQAGPLYAVWLEELREEFFKPHVPKQLVSFVNSRQAMTLMLALLDKPDRAWFGDNPADGRDQLLERTFAAAVKKTQKLLGDDPKQWRWGKLHTVSFEHPLAPLGPDYAKAFSLGPVERAGDGLTPNAASYNNKYQQISGASYRHVFDLADWDRGLATSTPGQSGQPGSPHYADLLPLWAESEYLPLAFSRPKVEELTKHRLMLKPGR